MNLRQLILVSFLLQGYHSWAEADFRSEQACLADLREVSLPPSANLTDSIPVAYQQVIRTDGFESNGREAHLSSDENVIFSPANEARHIYLVTGKMRYKCELPGKIGASARFLRFVIQDRPNNREYLDLGISMDRERRLEVSSQLKSGEVVNIVLGLLTTFGFGKVAAEVSERMNGDASSYIREVTCRESLDVKEVKADLRKAIVDRIDRLESHYDTRIREMSKSLQNLCKASDCDDNPALSDRTELAHERLAKELHEKIFASVKSCGATLKDDSKLTRRLEKIAERFDPHTAPPGFSAQGASATAF